MSQLARAPIALFVYNRPDLARLTLEALARNEGASDSDLIIFSDGAKGAADESDVAAVRRLIASARGFRSVNIIEARSNRGLADAIIDGVSAVTAQHGHVIVLEDDLVTSPYFLRFMNEALELYKDDEMVASVSGYMFPVAVALPESFFLPNTTSWGWATWKRAWANFEPDGKKLLAEIRRRRLSRTFDYDGTYPFLQMLRDQTEGKNNSWAIRWLAASFLARQLTLYPGRSLVSNIGNDGAGTHADSSGHVFDTTLRQDSIHFSRTAVQVHQPAFDAVRDFFRVNFSDSLKRRLVRKLRLLFGAT